MSIRLFAKIYFFIAIFCYGIFLKYGFEHPDIWSSPSTWLNWYVNFIGLSAVFSYAFIKQKLPLLFWRLNLIVMLSVYAYQLFENGLFSPHASKVAKITILANYAFLVIPLLLAALLNARIFKLSENDPAKLDRT